MACNLEVKTNAPGRVWLERFSALGSTFGLAGVVPRGTQGPVKAIG